MGVATAVAVGGALLGAYAGSQASHTSQHTEQSSGIDLNPASGLEQSADKGVASSYSALQSMVGAGPGQSDVSAATSQQRSLASMLSDYAKTGGAASQQDVLQAQEQAKLQFAPQQVALDQSFTQEKERAAQLAAQLGRPINDPYIQAQLGKERMNNMQMLAANQGAFVNQQSQQTAINRLGFAQQLTDTRNSLASQAMANRQALLSIGQGIQANERSWRLNTGTRWGTGQSDTYSGGGTKGAIEGGIAGFGAGMSAAGGMGQMGMFGMGKQGAQQGFTSSGGEAPMGMAGPSASLMTTSIMQPQQAMSQAMPSYSINPTRTSRVSSYGGMSSGDTLYNSAGTGMFQPYQSPQMYTPRNPFSWMGQ